MVGAEASIAVYIMASGRNGTLYIGVTSRLEQRVAAHKHGRFEGFSKRYGCRMLVWFEHHGEMTRAIAREKPLKRWLREWKLALIEETNPEWRDLAEDGGATTPRRRTPDSNLKLPTPNARHPRA